MGMLGSEGPDEEFRSRPKKNYRVPSSSTTLEFRLPLRLAFRAETDPPCIIPPRGRASLGSKQLSRNLYFRYGGLTKLVWG